MRELIRVLRALSDPNRMRIMKMLQSRDMCVCELAEALGISQPSVSRHMRILAEADLVLSRREGLWIHYLWNPAPSNPYCTDFLRHLRGWLEEDQEVKELLERARSLNREEICRGRAKSPRRASTEEIST